MASDEPVLGRRFLVTFLLVVGTISLAAGSFQILFTSTTSPTSIFEAVFGWTVVLVTWLFLAPTTVPRASPESAPGEVTVQRPSVVRSVPAAAAPLSAAPRAPTGAPAPGRAPPPTAERWREEDSPLSPSFSRVPPRPLRTSPVPAQPPSVSPREERPPGPRGRPAGNDEVMDELDFIAKALTPPVKRGEPIAAHEASDDAAPLPPPPSKGRTRA